MEGRARPAGVEERGVGSAGARDATLRGVFGRGGQERRGAMVPIRLQSAEGARGGACRPTPCAPQEGALGGGLGLGSAPPRSSPKIFAPHRSSSFRV